MRVSRIRGATVVLALALLLLLSSLPQALRAEMVAHIIDVGQGDAILLELPGLGATPGAQVLVDGGIPRAGPTVVVRIDGETGNYRLAADSGRSSMLPTQSNLFLPLILHSFGEPVPTPTPFPTPTLTPTPDHPVVEAWMSNGTPARFSTVTVYGRIHRNGIGIPGVPMHAVWHYRTTSPDCDGQSNADGVASCARNIGGASAGYYVRVVVTFTYAGQTYVAETGFTPQ